MLRWILLLTIALLPLRGWMGDAMAGERAAQVAAVHAAVVHHEEAPIGSPTSGNGHDHVDCMDDVQAQVIEGDPVGVAGGDCPTCSHCQACSGVALTSSSTISLPEAYDSLRPSATIDPFASADRAPGFKPPIS
jgi:hypothetical protein